MKTNTDTITAENVKGGAACLVWYNNDDTEVNFQTEHSYKIDWWLYIGILHEVKEVEPGIFEGKLTRLYEAYWHNNSDSSIREFWSWKSNNKALYNAWLDEISNFMKKCVHDVRADLHEYNFMQTEDGRIIATDPLHDDGYTWNEHKPLANFQLYLGSAT